jgi:hypothetical protein
VTVGLVTAEEFKKRRDLVEKGYLDEQQSTNSTLLKKRVGPYDSKQQNNESKETLQ